MGRLLVTALLFSAFSAHAELEMLQGHVRAMPPGQPNTAAFMHLKNTGDSAVTLVSAQTPAAKKSEYHTHTMNDKGVMSMTQVPSIVIEAGQVFTFKSGAHHIMLMGLVAPLKPGSDIPLILEDSLGHEHRYDVPVVSILNKPAMNHDHHKHHGQE